MNEYKAKVTRVVDGDTIDAEVDLGFNVFIKERFRLLGIDAPETRTKDLIEKARGLKTKAFVEDIINSSTEVVIKTNKAGKFGRWLAVVTLDGDTNLNNLIEMFVKTLE